MVKKALACTLTLSLLLPSFSCANPQQGQRKSTQFTTRPEIRAFIQDLVSHQGFDSEKLTRLFAKVKRQDKALEAIARPAETKPWYQYRTIFITPERITRGIQFWNDNEAVIQRAVQRYGVSAQILVAIIGVESFYGRRMGNFPIFDTLTTLGFDYPPRARFFRNELKQWLILARDESLDIFTLKGSYAGAMGQGQFIPSSYRQYAVDFDHDGKRDLWTSNADAIASVANYFQRHGWKSGAAVAIRANTQGTAYKNLLGRGMKPNILASSLKTHGITPADDQLVNDQSAFFEFEAAEGQEYWLGFNNFYVITRYNHSPLYAMAVYQLSQEIKMRRDNLTAQTP